MLEIALTQGKVAMVDDSDFEYLNRHKWYAHRHHRTWYAVRKVHGRYMPMHRALLCPADGVQIDHRDHNGLNNQRENLRIATNAQNQHNRAEFRGSCSLKGITWNKNSRKWQARIQVNCVRIHLGLFIEPLEAARTYDEAARKYFGEFAYCNFARSA